MDLRRRTIMAGSAGAWLAGAGAVLAADKRAWRIGMMSLSAPRTAYAPYFQALQELGYEEGRNLTVDYRFLQGRAELRPAVAAELVASQPDLLIAPLNPEAFAFKRATSSIPIVTLFSTEPVQVGLVSSLARPGGNITGTTTGTAQLAAKMTEVLRDCVPRLSRVVWLAEPDYPGMDLYWKAVEDAARPLRISATMLPVRSAADLDAALGQLERSRPDALGVSMTGPVLQGVSQIIELAKRLRLPALYSTPTPVRNGGLMSYAPDTADLFRRNARIVDKLFKGAKPADLPVEEPARFLLTINLATARAAGLTIPEGILMRADEVIR